MRVNSAPQHLRDQSELQLLREDNPSFAGTLAKGMMILQCFVSDPRPHANSELAKRLGIPRPTISRLCRTLQAMGYLDHDERLDRYFIGPAIVSLGYPYLISTPLLNQLRPAMQAMATQMMGAVSIGVAMDLDVVYLESCTHEQGTLKRPAVGAVRGIVETAMGRALLASLEEGARMEMLERIRNQRPDDHQRCLAGVEDSLTHYRKRGFAINLGDAGLGVLAVGVASRIRYGSRQLLFNCAVPGYRVKPQELLKIIGPRLTDMVRMADAQSGVR
jgi:DNA-binding IclR family transcriptional regulator